MPVMRMVQSSACVRPEHKPDSMYGCPSVYHTWMGFNLWTAACEDDNNDMDRQKPPLNLPVEVDSGLVSYFCLSCGKKERDSQRANEIRSAQTTNSTNNHPKFYIVVVCPQKKPVYLQKKTHRMTVRVTLCRVRVINFCLLFADPKTPKSDWTATQSPSLFRWLPEN